MKKTFIFGSIFCLLLFSCDSKNLLDEKSDEATNVAMRSGVSIPFTVTNMKAALQTILSYYTAENKLDVVRRFSNYDVNTTHYYYKFSPQDSLQYNALVKDTLIDMQTYPFEEKYVEPTTDYTEDFMPQFYAVVDAGHAIPEGVPVEVLEELHFTKEDYSREEDLDNIEFLLNLTYEARKMANHLDEDEIKDGYFDFSAPDNTAGRLFPKKWRPSGRIRVEEDCLTTLNNNNNRFYHPIRGARVNMLKWGWLQVEHGYSNDNGNFSGGTTWTKNITYNVKFKGDFFTVKEGNFFDTANHKSGSYKKQPWIHDFNTGGRSHFYALIHNAADDYFNRARFLYGLTNPFFTTISAKYHGSDSNISPAWVPLNSDIRVGRLYSNGVYRRSDGVYATTVHELTHKSHRNMDIGMFSILHHGNKERLLMKESWAKGVETIVTNQRYRMLFAAYVGSNSNTLNITNGWNGNKQRDIVADMDEYSPLVIDLNDNLNQNLLAGTNNTLPIDRVSGYTILQMQNALNNSRTLVEWRNKLVNNNNNATEANINDVFNYAEIVRSNL
jgi:hypothetical protein